MPGDVISPLVSSNMVVKNIGKVALQKGNIYLYKNQVPIPPLVMQDDTLGISLCGYKSTLMNNFLNTRTNIMNLQFGTNKCEKMHIGKNHNQDICSRLSVDTWKEILIEDDKGKKDLKDVFVGRTDMKEVNKKKYLGDVISNDGKNQANIKERYDKAIGNINKIESTLKERSYGKYYFKGYKLMREGLLLGGLLTNAESWINVTKNDLDTLEKPDVTLQRRIFSSSGNPCKTFMMLELAIVPVRFVISKKRLQFLHYILNESTTSMIRNVYEALKNDSRKGVFLIKIGWIWT